MCIDHTRHIFLSTLDLIAAALGVTSADFDISVVVVVAVSAIVSSFVSGQPINWKEGDTQLVKSGGYSICDSFIR